MRTALSSWLLGVAGAFVVLALLTLQWKLVLLTLPPLVYLALAGLRPISRPVLDASRQVSRDRASVGQEITVTLRIANRGPRLDLVEIFDSLPKELELKSGLSHVVLSLGAGEEVTISYKVVPRLRGRHVIGPITARTVAASGLEYEEVTLSLRTVITAAPQLEDVRKVRIFPRKTRFRLGQIASRSADLGTEFWGLREYRPGDETRRINWKASARFDRLITNETEGERSGDAVIIVDARTEALVGPLQQSTTEHCVRAALAVASKVLDGRNRVGLMVQREFLDWVYPAYGRKQLYRILDVLIRASPGGEWPLDHVSWVLERFFPRNCHIILITPFLNTETVSLVSELAARGFSISVVSPSATEIERGMYAGDRALDVPYKLVSMERQNAVRAMRRFADVADWDPNKPLATALRGVRQSPRMR